MLHKQIIVVEGPAGAGKSSLIQRLSELPNVGVVNSSLGKREFETQEAAIKSFLNDTRKISLAIVEPAPVVIIDRWCLSQIVYDAIRRSKKINIGSINSSLNLIECLSEDLISRSNQTQIVNLSWMILIPELEALEHHRLTGGKKYPHSPDVEIQLYKRITSVLLSRGSQVLKPQYNDLFDQNWIVDSFDAWLRANHFSFDLLWKSFALGRNFKL